MKSRRCTQNELYILIFTDYSLVNSNTCKLGDICLKEYLFGILGKFFGFSDSISLHTPYKCRDACMALPLYPLIYQSILRTPSQNHHSRPSPSQMSNICTVAYYPQIASDSLSLVTACFYMPLLL